MRVVRCGSGAWRDPFVVLDRIIRGPEDIARLRREGIEAVYVAPDRALSPAARPTPSEDARGRTPAVPLAQEFHVARKIYSRALGHAARLMEDVRIGRPFDAAGTLGLARDISESAGRCPRASASMPMLKSLGRIHNHSVNVAFLASAFGRYLGLGREPVEHLAAAGLLHDIGKMLLSERILAKPGPLTEQEFAEVKRHPVEGCKLLGIKRCIKAPVLRAVLDHHEHADGSGYPQGKTEQDIEPLALVLAIADYFDALISDRPYLRPLTPNRALARMFGERGRYFQAELLERFVKFMGVYPVGSLVRLDSGRVAVVADLRSEATTLHPVLKVVFDRRLRPVRPETLDLSETAGRPGAPRIIACLDPRAYNIEVGRLIA